jgi:PadR family transcriptional regulator, regulatory protein PadR
MNTRDINEINKDFQKGIYTGISVLILLRVVSQAGEPIYGYQIAKVIEKDNADIPVIKLGTLYPVLRSLEKDGLLESRVDPSVNGPPRRYYQITKAGTRALEQLNLTWQRAKNFVDTLNVGASDDK